MQAGGFDQTIHPQDTGSDVAVLLDAVGPFFVAMTYVIHCDPVCY